MAAHQAPPSLGFSRQEHWSGLPCPSPPHESEKWKWSRSVVSDPQRPHGLQPSRLLCPWDFLGKSTGVGCHCLLHLCKRGREKSPLPPRKKYDFILVQTRKIKYAVSIKNIYIKVTYLFVKDLVKEKFSSESSFFITLVSWVYPIM